MSMHRRGILTVLFLTLIVIVSGCSMLPSGSDVSVPDPGEPPVTNLLVNPGFEQIEEGVLIAWNLPSSGAAVMSTEPVRNGEHSLKVVRDSDTYVGFWQQVPVVEGKTYDLSGWIQSDDADMTVNLYIEFYSVSGSGGYIHGRGHDISDSFIEWTRVERSYEAPQGATLARPHFRIKGSGTVYFDDVALIAQE